MAGGSSQQQPTQTTTTQISPQAQQLFNVAYPNIAQFAAQPPPKYTGELVAPFTPAQTSAQQAGLEAAGSQADIARKAADVWSGIPANLTPFVGRDIATSSDITLPQSVWEASTPTLNAAITAAQRPTWEALTESALPAIRGTALGTTGLTTSGSRQGVAEGIATGKAARAAGDIAAGMTNQEFQKLQDLYNQRYGTNLQAELSRYGTNVAAEGQRYGQNLAALYQALGISPTISALQTAPAATMEAVGGQQQAMQQALTNEDYQKWLAANYGPYLQSRDILSLIQGMPGASTVSTANVPQANPWTQALGGAASGASIGSMFGPVGSGVGAAGGAVLPFLFR